MMQPKLTEVKMSDISRRKATLADVPCICEMVDLAKQRMYSEGIFQWAADYPGPKDFESDVANDALWVAVLDNEIVGVTALTVYANADYERGGCDNSIPAVTSHRMAVHPNAQGKGIGSALMQLAEDVAKDIYHYDVVRIDTHEKNMAMAHLVSKKFQYEYKGTILLSRRPGEVRNWYEKYITK